MTPERKAYLAKCSKREEWIREMIYHAEKDIVLCKAMLNPEYQIPDLNSWKSRLKRCKFELMAYRRELNRIKGMERVVVPRQVMIFASSNENFNVGDMLGRCKCGQNLDSVLTKFCPNCRRRILWEKVK